jgi:trk system potassium uptake protein TrkH
MHPTSVNEVKLGSTILRDAEMAPHLLYIVLYSVLLSFSVLLSMGFGVDPHNAFCASVTSIGNVGPAVGELGSMGNFNGISVAAKLLFTTDMFLGRVEIYPLLAVIGMLFDRHGR